MSNLVDYAKQELAMLSDDPMQLEINESILEVVKVFSEQGHSGSSANYAINMLKRLLNYMPIKPLTGEESEWGTDADPNQNKRCFAVFRDPETRTANYVDYRSFTDDDGKSWYRRGGKQKLKSSEVITFPFRPRGTVERVYLDKDENVIKVVKVDE